MSKEKINKRNRERARAEQEFYDKNKDSPEMVEALARLEEKIQLRIKTESKKCKTCKETKPLYEFYIRIRRGKHISVRSSCKSCFNKPNKKEREKRWKKEMLSRCKSRAKEKSLDFNLDLEFVIKELDKPCGYCDDTEILMTFDRLDNSKGYTKDNVVACCLRCNLIKMDMPKEAWLSIAPAIKNAREQQLFGKWIGRNRKYKRRHITK